MGIMLLLQPSISANASLSHTVSKGYLTDPAMDTLNLFAMQHFGKMAKHDTPAR